MKKYELNLTKNEELVIDVDDLMEIEIVKFKESVKGLEEKDVMIFDNWVKIYKSLNYDIIDDLTINNVYKVSNHTAVIKLTFRGELEYDILILNPETMTVACMNVKKNSIRNYIVRRLLIPDTAEDALSFAKSRLSQKGVKAISVLMNDIQDKTDKYDVTDKINLYDPEIKKVEMSLVVRQSMDIEPFEKEELALVIQEGSRELQTIDKGETGLVKLENKKNYLQTIDKGETRLVKLENKKKYLQTIGETCSRDFRVYNHIMTQNDTMPNYKINKQDNIKQQETKQYNYTEEPARKEYSSVQAVLTSIRKDGTIDVGSMLEKMSSRR